MRGVIMLNHECKKVLNCLIYFENNNINIENNSTFKGYLSNRTISKLESILDYLEDNDYLTYRTADDEIYDVELTYKGLEYKSFKLVEFKAFLFKSILVPIIVSALTTIITMWLQRLL